MIFIQWTSPAFRYLESLPQATAFGIIRQVDMLSRFPEMGAPLGTRFPQLDKYRQLVFKRRFRIVYDYDQKTETAYVLAVQSCRQKLPSLRDLKRARRSEE
jgi:mRNA-degrading endonuclease RelE of RelBE toxin-antitoxin system